jgi:transposase InsO family protein
MQVRHMDINCANGIEVLCFGYSGQRVRCNGNDFARHVKRIWQVNMQVYGADRVWKQLNREGISVARCTVELLMRNLGLREKAQQPQLTSAERVATA